MWPQPPLRRGPHPIARAVSRVLRFGVVIAVIMIAAGSAVWLLEDQQGRDDIQASLHDVPLLGRLVPDPDPETP